MRAAVLTAAGGPEVIAVREVPVPRPGPGDVLVRVRGTALNRADLLQRLGRYPAPPGAPSDIGGIELAGEVAELGDGVTAWTSGDRVMAICSGGAHAEFAVVPASSLVAIPAGLDWPRAAAIPEAFMTAYDAMIGQAGLVDGEVVLIHAVASGVGLAATQLAAAAGARPFGTTRTAHKLDAALAHGAAGGLVVSDPLAEIPPAVRAFSEGTGAQVTLDLLGGPYVSASVEAAAPRGRIMLVGTIAGAQAQLDLRRALGKRLTITGTVLRSRSNGEKADLAARFTRDVLPLFTRGAIRPTIDRVFPLGDIVAAHAWLESNQAIGKVVLIP